MEHPFFGGAMVGKLPADANDISEIREVPDHQEVFAHKDTDQSIIIEVLSYVQEETDLQAVKVHFEELASSNDASTSDNSCILGIEQLDKKQLSLTQCSAVYWLTGQQRVSKYQETARNNVNIHMILYRLPEFTTDLLVTFNDPVNVSPDSSSHHAVATSTVPWTLEDVRTLVFSLTLLNTGLFG
ncbi:ran guanine nucleotide release factor-like [Babylonia areolata]|uniref:ran guanine nucleotide release factor-like n=1 Tax=Babylonia areolata TaxID=304850 RepID=UPI003FD4F620